MFVNITDRPGAREEAKAVIDSLDSIGFIVYYKEWYDFHDLKTALETKICDIKDESSLLFVSIMAHGFGGHVKGSYEGSHGEINTLFGVIRQHLPEFVPLVSSWVKDSNVCY